MNRKEKFWAAYGFGVFVIVGAISLHSLIAREPESANLFFQNSVTAAGGATFTYREDARRAGTHTGGAVSLPIAQLWSTDRLNVGIHTASKSSPAVDASGIYVGADSGWFYAFNHDGSLKWKFYASDTRRGVHGTAALDEQYVYFGAYNGRLYCLKKSDGSPVWLVKLGHAIGSSPVIWGDSLFVTTELGSPAEGYGVRIKRKDGEIVWQTQWVGEQVHSSPAIDAENQQLVFGANNGKLTAFDLGSGAVKWTYNEKLPIKGTPAVIETQICFTSWAGLLTCLDGATGKVNWSQKLAGRSQSSPAFIPDKNVLVAASGGKEGQAVEAFNVKTGERVWDLKSHVEINELYKTSGVTVRRGEGGPWYVWISCADLTLCALEPSSGKVLQRLTLPNPLTGTPTVYDGAVFVALDNGALIKFGSARETH